VDNGVICLRMLERLHRRVHCDVLTKGELGSRQRANLLGVKINMPSITEKDRQDVESGISLGGPDCAIPRSRTPCSSGRIRSCFPGETTVEKYPLECLTVLDRIAQRIERSGDARYAGKVDLTEKRRKIVRSAVIVANELKTRGI